MLEKDVALRPDEKIRVVKGAQGVGRPVIGVAYCFRADQGGGAPEAPALKVFASELMQRVAQTGMQLLQLYGQLRPRSKWALLAGAVNRLYLTSVSSTIAADTSEIQRNIIAERGLGLPR